MGDLLQFVRYAKLIERQRGGKVIVGCHGPVKGIVARVEGVSALPARSRASDAKRVARRDLPHCLVEFSTSTSVTGSASPGLPAAATGRMLRRCLTSARSGSTISVSSGSCRSPGTYASRLGSASHGLPSPGGSVGIRAPSPRHPSPMRRSRISRRGSRGRNDVPGDWPPSCASSSPAAHAAHAQAGETSLVSASPRSKNGSNFIVNSQLSSSPGQRSGSLSNHLPSTSSPKSFPTRSLRPSTDRVDRLLRHESGPQAIGASDGVRRAHEDDDAYSCTRGGRRGPSAPIRRAAPRSPGDGRLPTLAARHRMGCEGCDKLSLRQRGLLRLRRVRPELPSIHRRPSNRIG